ncbi:MAG: alpha/beta hydrolase [Sphingomonadales bacterium]|nr:alpha/beta hydrolase [Sphingomonadales bacterium]
MDRAVADLAFESEATNIAAKLYRPKDKDRAPVVVMAHGFTAVMEHLEPQARSLQAAGFAVLAFDHPCFGLSGGEPRGEVDPPRQLRAWRDAVSFVRTLDGLDGDRIGLWGSSFSGGHVIQAGALDPRVRCVVSQVPFVAGWDLIAGWPDSENFIAQMIAERESRSAGQPPTMLTVCSTNPETPCAFPGEAAQRFFVQDHVTTWENAVTLSSFEYTRGYEPGLWVPPAGTARLARDRRRTMTVVTPAPPVLEAFARAGEPKRLVHLPGGHFDVYERPGFDQAMAAAIDWYREHLV